MSIPTDARDPASVKQAFETIRKELGAPDVLVYNAGGFKYGGILDIDPTEFDNLWKVRLSAAMSGVACMSRANGVSLCL